MNTDFLHNKILDLEKELQKLKTKYKYGLNWEDDTNLDFDMPFIVEEVIEKQIILNKNMPINLLIEGDNYHSLKYLVDKYDKKIDLIYIDPPYNTGNNDFIYNDHFNNKEYIYKHSAWLNFMNKRLIIAKKLMSPSGLIFISIDDTELSHLKILCDQIFGEQNRIGLITWQQFHSVKNNAKNFSRNTEFILVYSNEYSKNSLIKNEPFDKSDAYKLNDNDGKGFYKHDILYSKSKWKTYSYTFKDGREWSPPEGTYPRYTQETLKEMEENNEIIWKIGNKQPNAKRYLNKIQEGKKVSTLWLGQEVGYSMTGDKLLKNIIGKKFENPKPLDLIKRIIKISTNKNSIILDFFAGSGTTGHAVLDVNKEDNGNRQFILCTNNENMICENITYERIKKVLIGYDGIKDKVEGLDGNLSYLKINEISVDN